MAGKKNIVFIFILSCLMISQTSAYKVIPKCTYSISPMTNRTELNGGSLSPMAQRHMEKMSLVYTDNTSLNAELAPSDTEESTRGTVTRKDIVNEVSKELGISKAETERVVSSFLGLLHEHMLEGKRVYISKLGIFGLKRRGERLARNPKTGEALDISAATFPTFSYSKSVKAAVRNIIPLESGSDDKMSDSKEKSNNTRFGW